MTATSTPPQTLSDETVATPVGGSRAVIGILLVATFVVILNETIMGVALPPIDEACTITPNTAQWLSTAFMLTMAVVIPTTGFLLQRLTTRTVFVLAMTLFSRHAARGLGAGALAAAARRVVQACGTAIMLPLLMTTVLTLVPSSSAAA